MLEENIFHLRENFDTMKPLAVAAAAALDYACTTLLNIQVLAAEGWINHNATLMFPVDLTQLPSLPPSGSNTNLSQTDDDFTTVRIVVTHVRQFISPINCHNRYQILEDLTSTN